MRVKNFKRIIIRFEFANARVCACICLSLSFCLSVHVLAFGESIMIITADVLYFIEGTTAFSMKTRITIDIKFMFIIIDALPFGFVVVGAIDVLPWFCNADKLYLKWLLQYHINVGLDTLWRMFSIKIAPIQYTCRMVSLLLFFFWGGDISKQAFHWHKPHYGPVA